MSIKQSFNFVKSAFRHPCAVGGPQVVITTALQAAVPVLFSLNQFSCLDILKTRAGISWKCGRSLKGIIKSAHNPKVVNNGHFLYQLGAAQGERLLWWWFVADLAAGFVADWTSMMYQESGCEAPGSTHFDVPVYTEFLFPQNHGDPNASPPLTRDAHIGNHRDGQCAQVEGDTILVPGGCTATISYDVEWKPFRDDPNNNGPVKSWLEDQHGKQYMPIVTDPKKWKPGEANAFSAVTHLDSFFADRHEYKIKWEVQRGLMGAGVGHCRVTTTGRAVTVFPVSCKPKPVSVPNWVPGFTNPAY